MSFTKAMIYTLVILVHLLIVFTFFSGSCTHKPTADGPTAEAVKAPEAQSTPQAEVPGNPPATASAEQGAPGTATAQPTAPQKPHPPKIGLYTPTYYARENRALPTKLATDAGTAHAVAVIDVSRHALLYGRNEGNSLPIASLTKMMTVNLLMEDLQAGKQGLTLDTPVKVTKAAAAIGGHQVWLDPRETFTIDELLKCVIIRSANDCAFLLGEFLANGDISAFIARMNSRAKELGCRGFLFHNSHGLPTNSGKENQGNPLELAYMAERLWQYPEVMRWAATRQEFIREKTKPFQLDTTNNLLRTCPGVNGLKTGMTNAAGFCLVATCERNERRVIVVVLGMPSAKARDKLAAALVEWAYEN